jgi:hypothetical protein
VKVLHTPFGALSQPIGSPAGARVYARRVRALFGANLIHYLRLDETSGAAAQDFSLHGNHGAYQGVNLANASLPPRIGGKAPRFDGSSDYVYSYSAGLNGSFDGDLIWAKVVKAAVWTDGSWSRCFHFEVDANYAILVLRRGSDNRLTFIRKANGASVTVNKDGVAATDWMFLGITWDQSADELKAYFNGAQEGSTQSGLNAWSGNLHADRTLIGANLKAPTNVWNGWLGHCMVLDRVAAPGEIRQAYTWGM